MDLGQLFLIGFNGCEYNEELEELLVKYKAGGFILFKRNISDSRYKLKTLIDSIYKRSRELSLPKPLIAIDHEGGRVHRLKELATKFPAPGNLLHLSDEDLLSIYKQQSKELAYFGFNMVLGPVLDPCPINDDGGGISDRSFGSDTKIVIEKSKIAISGLQSYGVISVPKHFPSYSFAKVDPHLNLPLVDRSMAQFEAYNIVPFRAVIDNNISSIMSAHLLAPQIDAEYPATISKIWIDYLRNKLGFKGVLISDDLCMKSVWDRLSIEKISEIGLLAGVDLFCICFNEREFTDSFKRSFVTLEKFIKSNKNAQIKFEEALKRVMTLKDNLNLKTNGIDESIFEDGQELFSKVTKLI